MNRNTLSGLFNWVIACSTKWLGPMLPTETPSRRYVRRLRTRPIKSTAGSTGSKMSKLLDRDWSKFKYVNAAESSKEGYLRKRMKMYKELNGKNTEIHNVEERSDDRRRTRREVPGGQINGQNRNSLVVIRGKVEAGG